MDCEQLDLATIRRRLAHGLPLTRDQCVTLYELATEDVIQTRQSLDETLYMDCCGQVVSALRLPSTVPRWTQVEAFGNRSIFRLWCYVKDELLCISRWLPDGEWDAAVVCNVGDTAGKWHHGYTSLLRTHISQRSKNPNKKGQRR